MNADIRLLAARLALDAGERERLAGLWAEYARAVKAEERAA
ncbi:hypothetical protein [Actinacidiphila sp. ITFR-21]|nr:hypothetical protein [Streptomyces sp. ITFR-21]WNI19240.1 hypothetical protein RLT57_29295 [Streptomyces sp. ITFR-21]